MDDTSTRDSKPATENSSDGREATGTGDSGRDAGAGTNAHTLSRRSFVTYGTLAASTLPGGTATATTSRTDQLVLLPLNDYRPDLTVRVVGRLPATITDRLLRLPNGETVPVATQPDEYTGYVVRSRRDPEQVETTTLVFLRGTLEPDGQYEFTGDASVFSDRLNLVRASVSSTDADGEDERNAWNRRNDPPDPCSRVESRPSLEQRHRDAEDDR